MDENNAEAKQPLTINSNVYDKMKSFVQVVGPAVITFYIFMGQALEWDKVEVYAGIGTAFLTMLGVFVTWMSANFKKSDARFDGHIEVSEDENGVKQAALVLKNYENPADVVNQDQVTFKVSKV